MVRLDHLEEQNDLQWQAIDKLRNRLPLWCTFLLMAAGGLIGTLFTLLAQK